MYTNVMIAKFVMLDPTAVVSPKYKMLPIPLFFSPTHAKIIWIVHTSTMLLNPQTPEGW